MNYRNLGRTGLRVSEIGLGTHVNFGGILSDEENQAVMAALFDLGGNIIDTAEAYNAGKAEELIGRTIKKNGWSRDYWVICSKVIFKDRDASPTQKGLSRKHIFDAVDGSLTRLGTDYLDIYLCHHDDPLTPVEETCRAMSDLVALGKIRYWGTSNPFPMSFMAQAMHTLERCNGYLPTVKMTGWCIACPRSDADILGMYGQMGLGILANTVLGGGNLTAKYLNGAPAGSRKDRMPALKNPNPAHQTVGNRNDSMLQKLTEAGITDELGISPARLACAWALKHPHVSSLILGASRPEQVRENAKACDDTKLLTEDVMARIASFAESL